MKDNELIRKMHNNISNPEPKKDSSEKYYEIVLDENRRPQKRELTKEEAQQKAKEFNQRWNKDLERFKNAWLGHFPTAAQFINDYEKNKPICSYNDVNESKTTDHNPNTVKETRTVEPQPSVTYVSKAASAMDINEIISALKTPSVREEIKSIIREVESEEPILADNAEQRLKSIVKDALEEAEMEIMRKLFTC